MSFNFLNLIPFQFIYFKIINMKIIISKLHPSTKLLPISNNARWWWQSLMIKVFNYKEKTLNVDDNTNIWRKKNLNTRTTGMEYDKVIYMKMTELCHIIIIVNIIFHGGTKTLQNQFNFNVCVCALWNIFLEQITHTHTDKQIMEQNL